MSQDELFLMRRRKGITLKMLADKNVCNCSIALISLHENGKANMDINKQVKYRDYIINY